MVFEIVLQVSFTPNGMDMRMLQPSEGYLRRHFLPGVKVEYSVSPRQSAYRVQIHRIQVKRSQILKKKRKSSKIEYIHVSITVQQVIQLPSSAFVHQCILSP